ncbi:major facilitator superfamily transporter [Cryptosporidium andersoni]|uniref:Major facilitator superfamily transporter n=1 Tax=Cryptosporidium andersoni TaxID=117008 RepID=A0A1J4MS69_9CRYT|nr:major facilitator superfamily transporter [Cryptosporidium andersoni]
MLGIKYFIKDMYANGQMSINIKRLTPLLGGFCLNIALGMVYSMGNVSMYVASYMRWKNPNSPKVTLTDISWVYTLNVALLGIMLPFGGYINHKLGVRLSLYISCFLFTSSTFIASYVVSSYTGFLITFGCIIGIADGFAFNLPQYCAFKYWPNHMGLVSSFVISGLALSPVIFSPIQTRLVNPLNMIPNLIDGNSMYYSQDEILMRVPYMFTIMGYIISLLCAIAILTLKEPNEDYDISIKYSEVQESPIISNNLFKQDSNIINKNSYFDHECKESIKYTMRQIYDITTPTSTISTIPGSIDLPIIDNMKRDTFPTLIIENNKSSPIIQNLTNDLDDLNFSKELFIIKGLIYEKQFWVIFCLFFSFSQFVHFLASWWKVIGIVNIGISDDILATYGTLVTAGTNILGRLVYGYFLDKYKGKFCFRIISILCLIFMFILLLSIKIQNAYVYLITLGVLFFHIGAGFVIFPPITAMSFGVKYFSFIYGLIYIGRTFGVLFNSFLTSLLLSSIGVELCSLVIIGFTLLFSLLCLRICDDHSCQCVNLQDTLFLP